MKRMLGLALLVVVVVGVLVLGTFPMAGEIAGLSKNGEVTAGPGDQPCGAPAPCGGGSGDGPGGIPG